MKRFSLLILLAMLAQSVYGIPIDGDNSWSNLINRYMFLSYCQAVKVNTLDYYQHLCIMEKELNAINTANLEDIDGLIFFYDNMCDRLSLKENNCSEFTSSELNTMKAELIAAISDLKFKYNLTNLQQTSKTIAKYAGAAALIAGTIYAINNRQALKEKASVLTSKALASDFASKVTEVGSQISTSVANSEILKKAIELKASYSAYLQNAYLMISNHAQNLCVKGAENIVKASEKAGDTYANTAKQFDFSLKNFNLF